MTRIENYCNIPQTLAYIIVAAGVKMKSGPRLEVMHYVTRSRDSVDGSVAWSTWKVGFKPALLYVFL
jgi:hypothetical protein